MFVRLLNLIIITWLFFISTLFGQSNPKRYLIKNISIIDIQQDTVRKALDVLIEEEIISEIKPYDSGRLPDQTHIIDGKGKFLLPGLIDSHVHLREPDAGLPVYIGFGVTTVRVMEGSERILNLKKKVSRKNLFAPNILTTTPYIEDLIGPDTDIHELISSLKSEGYDLVKIHDDISESHYQHLMEAVRKTDMKLVGHAQRDKSIEYILDAGQHEISHGEEFIYTFFDDQVKDTHLIDNLVQKVAASNTVVVPNIVFFKGMYQQATDQYFQMISDTDLIYVSADRRHAWINDSHRFYIDQDELPWYRNAVELLKKLTLKLHDSGVTILAGSDTPLEFMIPGKSLVQELYNFVSLGFTPAEALRTATVHAAEFMDQDKLGKIDVGYRADLLVLNENPLENIRNIEKLQGIFLRGKWYPKNTIDIKLNEVSNDYHKGEIKLNARKAAIRQFKKGFEGGRIDSVVAVYKKIDENTSLSLLSESTLNDLGYELLSENEMEEAIMIFKLNTDLYPQSANTWDSLGESYWENGEISKAIESYKKALQINPQFENAKQALKELQKIK